MALLNNGAGVDPLGGLKAKRLIAIGMGYDDILDPRELRNALLHGLAPLEAHRARTGCGD